MPVVTTRPSASSVPRPARVRRGGRTEWVCDTVLVFGVLALASWTLAYHACLPLGLGARFALVALAVASVPCGVLAARAARARPQPAESCCERQSRGPGDRSALLAAVAGGLAIAAALALAFVRPPWPVTWALWAGAAGAVLIAAARRPLAGAGRTGRGGGAALAWASGLAVLTLLLVKPNSDDTYYLRQAAWTAEHGRFPLRDTLHSHDVLPAAFSPPLASWDALLGATAGATGLSSLHLAHLVVAPAAAVLAVLALWRLLRAWAVRMEARALSVALLFLLFAVEHPHAPTAAIGHLPGDFFVARIWQGKVILVGVLVPLLFALLHDYAARPRRGSLALLAAAGTAAVGLSTTAAYLVPVIAAALLVPLAPRSPLRAAAGAAAASAYPVAAMATALLAASRQPARWRPEDIAPEALVLPAVGAGALGCVAVTCALAGPLWLARPHARLGTAAASLAVALAFAPGLPQLVYELTGLGRPVWRLMWGIPIAALVGAVAAQITAHHRLPAVRLLPPLVVGAIVALAGTPVWQGRNTELAREPALKRHPDELAVASRLSTLVRGGDVVLAPPDLSATLLMLDGRVTAVAPRLLYTQALPASLAARREQRLRLWAFARAGRPDGTDDEVVAALRAVGVDVACLRDPARSSRRLLVGAGYRPVVRLHGVWCGAARPR